MSWKLNLQCFLVALTCCVFAITRVAAQKPLVDPQKTNPTQTITTEELNKIPASRNVLDLIKEIPGTPPSYSTTVGQGPGMNIININGPANQSVTFYLPNEIIVGQTFTGTKTSRSVPGGETKTNQFVARWEEGRFHWKDAAFGGEILRQETGEFTLILTRQENNVRYGFAVPVQPEGYGQPATSEIPTSGTYGHPIQIRYPTGGLLPPNTYFRIGGTPAPILTSTPGSLVIQNNYTTPGLAELETNIGGIVERHRFRNITLRLSADKTSLVKGETTPLQIEVAGLANLRAPATMTIDATGVISMAGGNSQKFAIPRTAIGADGIYRTGKTLTGTSAGGFGVKVTVVVEKEGF